MLNVEWLVCKLLILQIRQIACIRLSLAVDFDLDLSNTSLLNHCDSISLLDHCDI